MQSDMPKKKLPERVIPEDFPRQQPLGAVPGAQPKLLLVKVGNMYLSSSLETEREQRYDVCLEFLEQQLAPYAQRKLALHPEWGRAGLEARLLRAIQKKRWFTDPETQWMVERVCRELDEPHPTSGHDSPDKEGETGRG